MAGNRLPDEERYFRTRDAQLLDEAERQGISRRALLGGAAAGLPLLAVAGSSAAPAARADTPPPAPPAPPVRSSSR